MLGYIALLLLIIGYTFMFFSYEKIFYIINITASVLFSVHAYLIRQYPFLIANLFIAFLLFTKLISEL